MKLRPITLTRFGNVFVVFVALGICSFLCFHIVSNIAKRKASARKIRSLQDKIIERRTFLGTITDIKIIGDKKIITTDSTTVSIPGDCNNYAKVGFLVYNQIQPRPFSRCACECDQSIEIVSYWQPLVTYKSGRKEY